MDSNNLEKLKTILVEPQTPMKLIKDSYVLSTPVESKEMSDEDVREITEVLTEQLKVHGGLGLSANQVGLDVRACIINVKEPLVLINPVITDTSNTTVIYGEQCISIDKSMKKVVRTVRHKTLTVYCDNLGEIQFSPDMEQWKNSVDFFGDEGLLESVCVQHELDHLNGVLITDKSRKYSTTVVNGRTYSRNEKVMVRMSDGSTELLKYKHAEKLRELGAEIL